MYIPVNSKFTPCASDPVTIYLKSNGVHTDFVVPTKNEIKDWSIFVDPAATREGDLNASYVSFGWGDKGFYLETPRWRDLKFSTAFKALFWLSSAAMHVTFYDKISENEKCIKVSVSKEAYQKLVTYIEEGFQTKAGKPLLIEGASYGNNDIFYEAQGTYNLFFTCNTWTNSGLKAAGLKACMWTPAGQGILYQYSAN